jgi:hypothetical protein
MNEEVLANKIMETHDVKFTGIQIVNLLSFGQFKYLIWPLPDNCSGAMFTDIRLLLD